MNNTALPNTLLLFAHPNILRKRKDLAEQKNVMGLVLHKDRCKHVLAAPRTCFCTAAALQQSGSGNTVQIFGFLLPILDTSVLCEDVVVCFA